MILFHIDLCVITDNFLTSKIGKDNKCLRHAEMAVADGLSLLLELWSPPPSSVCYAVNSLHIWFLYFFLTSFTPYGPTPINN